MAPVIVVNHGFLRIRGMIFTPPNRRNETMFVKSNVGLRRAYDLEAHQIPIVRA